MHDPMTVAFHIRYPWRDAPTKLFPEGYRHEFATIWHVDPESDGSDDSCGWSFVKLNDEDRALAREMIDWEQKFPHYFAAPQRVPNPEYPSLWEIGPGDASALMLSAWQYIAWRLHRRRLSPRLAMQALSYGCASGDNFAGSLAATNPEDQYRAMLFIIRAYKTAVRPWYRHPRWHVHHWRLQVRPAQALKRWLFTRCAECGGRFKWGESGIGTWHGDGPRWFRSEHLTHMDCHAIRSAIAPTPQTVP